jgi:hypothetical protein
MCSFHWIHIRRIKECLSLIALAPDGTRLFSEILGSFEKSQR